MERGTGDRPGRDGFSVQLDHFTHFASRSSLVRHDPHINQQSSRHCVDLIAVANFVRDRGRTE